ncbi:MAG: THUMP domain-containing protein [Cyanobacteria bacterium J06642_2]
MDRYFVTVARGLEKLAAEELERLGARSLQPGFCGIEVEGDREFLYRANLWARLPFRLLVKLAAFPCRDGSELYRGIQTIDWSTYLTPNHTLAVRVTGKTRQLNHSHFTALQVKNAIVDLQRQQFGDRSHVDVEAPDIQVAVHLERDRCTVSLDSSARSLHRRGYRQAMGAAPLKESLAAALVYMTGWTGNTAFLDPLCGSGTLPLEAAAIALNRAPGLYRDRYGFQSWPDYDPELWQDILQDAWAGRGRELTAPVMGSDRDPETVQQARANAKNCDLERQVQFSCTELADVEAPADCGVLLCNPPYGRRIDSDRDLGGFYKLLGNVLKQRFKGWTAFILSGNKELAMSIGLKSSQRTLVYNGSLPCQLMKYEIY